MVPALEFAKLNNSSFFSIYEFCPIPEHTSTAVYTIRDRDCSIQSLQQRTFNFDLISLSLIQVTVSGERVWTCEAISICYERHQLVARLEAVCDR